MADFDLQIALDRLAESLLPDDEMHQQKANAVAIAKDGGVSSRSLVRSLPWYRADVMLPGAVVADTNNVRLAFPQGAHLRHVAVSAREAPSGGPFAMRFSVTGGGEQRVSLQPGESTFMTGVSLPVPPGGWLSGSVTGANGVHDLLITVHYSPLSGGS